MSEFQHKFIVKHDDIDQQGHVNDVRYVQWIQDVALAHWSAVATAEQQANITWFALRHEIDYLHRAFEDDKLRAPIWVGAASGAKCERLTEITRQDETLVKARSLWCSLDSKSLRPLRLDDELKERFGVAR